jgi:hypothetical protein
MSMFSYYIAIMIYLYFGLSHFVLLVLALCSYLGSFVSCFGFRLIPILSIFVFLIFVHVTKKYFKNIFLTFSYLKNGPYVMNQLKRLNPK